MKKKTLFLLGSLWLMIMVAVLASALTLMASGGGMNVFKGENGEIIQRYSRLEEIRRELEENYYLPVDEETLINGAIDGMLASLKDPYTFYYTPEEMLAHEQETGKEYSGVGLLVQNNALGYIEVLRVYEDGPADAASIRAGDYITRINGCAVSGESAQDLSDAVELLRVNSDEKVQIEIERSGVSLNFELIPGAVSINNVVYSMIDGDVGYINIFQFSGNAVEGFKTALESLEAAGAQSLIVDVRNNPGGLLDDVVAVADTLLGEGLIVYTQDRAGARQNYYSDASYCELPMTVLMNEMSASASEILAAAVQDHGRGLLVGQNSYGKGVVQTLLSYEADGAGMQYTSACYYTPAGKSIQGTGVTPDIQVNSAEGFHSYTGIADLENDLQLQAALACLKGE